MNNAGKQNTHLIYDEDRFRNEFIDFYPLCFNASSGPDRLLIDRDSLNEMAGCFVKLKILLINSTGKIFLFPPTQTNFINNNRFIPQIHLYKNQELYPKHGILTNNPDKILSTINRTIKFTTNSVFDLFATPKDLQMYKEEIKSLFAHFATSIGLYENLSLLNDSLPKSCSKITKFDTFLSWTGNQKACCNVCQFDGGSEDFFVLDWGFGVFCFFCLPVYLKLSVHNLVGRQESTIRNRDLIEIKLGQEEGERDTENFNVVSETISKCKNIIVVTGAGISTSAGIPDFRSEDGLYNLVKKRYPNIVFKGKDLFDASILNTRETAAVFFSFMAELKTLINNATVTPTHEFIKFLNTQDLLHRCYTQNIDSIESKVGLNCSIDLKNKINTKIIQLHGDMDRVICTMCRSRFEFSDNMIEIFKSGFSTDCIQCLEKSGIRKETGKRAITTGSLRPNITLYNEAHATGDEIGSFISYDIGKPIDALIVMGTSLKVIGVQKLIRDLAEKIHSKNNGLVILINKTPLGDCWADVFDFVVFSETDLACERMRNVMEFALHERKRATGKEFQKFRGMVVCLVKDNIDEIYEEEVLEHIWWKLEKDERKSFYNGAATGSVKLLNNVLENAFKIVKRKYDPAYPKEPLKAIDIFKSTWKVLPSWNDLDKSSNLKVLQPSWKDLDKCSKEIYHRKALELNKAYQEEMRAYNTAQEKLESETLKTRAQMPQKFPNFVGNRCCWNLNIESGILIPYNTVTNKKIASVDTTVAWKRGRKGDDDIIENVQRKLFFQTPFKVFCELMSQLDPKTNFDLHWMQLSEERKKKVLICREKRIFEYVLKKFIKTTGTKKEKFANLNILESSQPLPILNHTTIAPINLKDSQYSYENIENTNFLNKKQKNCHSSNCPLPVDNLIIKK